MFRNKPKANQIRETAVLTNCSYVLKLREVLTFVFSFCISGRSSLHTREHHLFLINMIKSAQHGLEVVSTEIGILV